MIEDNNLEMVLFRSRYLKQKNYWTKKLSGQVETTDFLKGSKNYRGDTFETGDISAPVNRRHYEIPFDDKLSRLFLNMCKHSELSLYILLLSALKALIHRYTNHKDIIILSPIQEGKATEETINSLVLIRSDVDGTRTFKELVLDLRKSVLEAYENQDYPYEKLAEYLFPSSSPSHISCWLENIHREADIEKIKTRLSFCFSTGGEKIEGHVLYDPNFYRESEIQRIPNHFVLLLTRVSENIDARIANLEFLMEEEKNQLLKEFNNNKVDFSRNKTLQRWFEEQVEKTPDAVAMACNHHQITYKELNQRANRLANLLRIYNLQQDWTVGILFNRSLQMAESILAVWKAGGAYIPLDTDDSIQRLQGVLADSSAAVLLSQTQWAAPQLEKAYNGNILLLDEPQKGSRRDKENRVDLNLAADPGSLAYVIYTSGSTGKPKGAMVEHIGMMNHIHAKIDDLQITQKSIVAQNASHTFDISVWQFFTALTKGGKTIIYPDNMVLEPDRFISRIIEDQVTILEVVPSYLSVMLEFLDANFRHFDSLKYLLVTGEIIKPGLVNRWFDKYPAVKMVNAYGPTEASDDITHFIIDKALDIERVPIGKPVRNLNIYIMDEYMNLCPLGVLGEICVSGIGVGRGYLNNPGLTAENFINYKLQITNHNVQNYKPNGIHASMHPCNHASMQYHYYSHYPPHSPIYLTGDLGRWLPGGIIEFLGRKDHQVKIRGFRIELGEIETHLANHPGIKEAVVIVKAVPNPYLCAYLAPSTGKKPGIPAIKEYLENHLPAHMVPENFIELEHMPLTSNGKIDRKALSRLDDRIPVKKEYALPRGRLEKKLVQVWAEVLGIEPHVIGIDTNFFQLGGNSLRATVLIAKLNKTLDVKIPLVQLFENSTIRELARYIEGLKQYSFVSIGTVEDKEYYPQSSSQERLYVLQQMELEAAAYNVRFVMVLEGELDKNRLEGMFQELIQRHESLRTSFHIIDEESVQQIHEKVEFKIEYYDISKVEAKVKAYVGTGLAPLSVEPAARSPQPAVALISSFIRPFDLSCPPLLRVGLIKVQDQKHILMIDMHHIITDGVSMDLFVRETMALYKGEKLPPLRLRYRDYSEWQTSERQKKAIKEQEEYWLRQFEDEVPVLDMPFDYPRPAVQSFEGAALFFELPMKTIRALNQLARHTGATLYMVLLAIYNILLSKLSGQEDIVVGTPIAGRNHADLQQIIGMFVNTLALRNYPAGEKTFETFLKELKERTLQAFENQTYPFEDLVEKVEVARDMSRNPLFDVMFVLQDFYEASAETTGIPGDSPGKLKVKSYPFEDKTSKFDFIITAVEAEEKLDFSFTYCTRLFKEETMARFSQYFKTVISRVMENPKKKILEIEIIAEGEKNRLLWEFNNTKVEYPGDKTVHQLFVEQVEKSLNYTALIGQIPNSKFQISNTFAEMHLSYQELNERANQLSYLLKTNGVKPDTIVGIMVVRSIEMIIGIFGILKAGGAYLPIDPEYPDERIKYMLKDSSAKILVTAPGLSEKFEKLLIVNCQLLMVNEKTPGCRRLNIPPKESNSVNNYQLNINNLQLEQANLAYIIYTSGSTGKSRGVVVEHASLMNILIALQKQYPVHKQGTYLLKTSYVFDVSVTELFGWFLGGGRLAIAGCDGEKDPDKIIDTIERHEVTHLNFVPSMFNVFSGFLNHQNINRISSLKYILLAGEALLPHHVEKIRSLDSQIKLENIYGPTEATIYASGYSLSDGEAGSTAAKIGTVPIGKPLSNIRLYILDKYDNLLPGGVVGELCISGVGLARGYLNRPEFTTEKFVEQVTGAGDRCRCINKKFLRGSRGQFLQKAPPGRRRQKLYKTGDLSRWLADGNIEFLGRMDWQVKTRGFRIELGEIENRLLKHSKIKEAVVISREDNPGDKYLCAYICPSIPPSLNSDNAPDKNNESPSREELREYLSQILPDYMIPTHFILLEKIPLTTSGKTDRRKLPEPEIKAGEGQTPPRDGIEKKMVEIWGEALNINTPGTGMYPAIGIDDNFFKLGGHSLKVMKMVSLIHKEFNVKLGMAQVFETPHIRGLTGLIKEEKIDQYSSIAPVEKKDYYVLSPAQRRMYIVHQMNMDSRRYNITTAVQLIGSLALKRLRDTFQELIQRHESLRTSFIMLVDEPVQKIHDEIVLEMEYYETSEEEIPGLMKNFIRPFNLARAPLMRAGLIKTGKDSHLLITDTHHVISDGVSINILTKDFMTLYRGEELPGLNLQYKDFSEWQNNLVISGEIERQMNYWLNMFAGEIPVLNLPTDFPRPKVQRFGGYDLSFDIDEELFKKLDHLTKKTGTTLFMVLLAVLHVLLSKHTGQEDIVIGSANSGRTHADLGNIIGMFVGQLALRNQPRGDKTFREFLREVKENALQAYENQDYQFDVLVNRLGLHGNYSRHPLFDVVFAFQDWEIPESLIPGLKIKQYEYEEKTSKTDLRVESKVMNSIINMKITYATALFKRSTIERMADRFIDILNQVLENVDVKLADIRIAHKLAMAKSNILQKEKRDFGF